MKTKKYIFQQWRLFPYLADAYAFMVLAVATSQAFVDFNILVAFKNMEELVIFFKYC